MLLRLRRAILAAALALCVSAQSDPVGSGWTMGLSCPPKGADGSGTMVAGNTGGFGAAGTCRRVKGLFSKISFDTFGGGTLRSTSVFSLQTPSVLITPPLLTTEAQPIFTVANACPIATGTLDLNWLFVQWTDAERRALTNTHLFGTATYSSANGVIVTGQHGIDGSVYWAGPRPLAGSCSNGVYTATNTGPEQDADGKIYFNAAGMGAYKTTAGRATFFFPRYTITAATDFGSKTFRGLAFDSDAGNGVGDVRQIKGTANGAGTTFTVQALSDPESDVVDSGGSAYTDTVVFTGGNINNPAPGMLFGSVTRTGSGAGSGSVACIANGRDGDVLLLCSGQSPSDNSLPFHFSLYAENTHNKSRGPNATVNTLVREASSGKLYVGGQFSTFNGTGRRYVARVHGDGTLDTGFDPGAGFNGFVHAMALDSSTGKLYTGGFFSMFEGVVRNDIARLNSDGTLDTAFDPGTGFDNLVEAVAFDSVSGKLYVGGSFTLFNGTGRNRIARLNGDGSLDTTFAPGSGFDNTVYALAFHAASGTLYVGGNFTTFNGTGRNGIARLLGTGAIDTAFDPGSGLNGTVDTIALDASGKPYLGGQFTTFNGTGRNRIAVLNTGGSLDTAFDPGTGLDSTVQAIALDVSTGDLYLGGNFTTCNDVGRNFMALLQSGGTLESDFNPGSGFNGTVQALGIDSSSGKLYVGGSFSTFDGVSRTSIARLQGDGALDTGFATGTGFDSSVKALAFEVSSGKVYAGGFFSFFNGTGRNRVARLNGNGTLDTAFNPGFGFNAVVNALALDTSTGKLYGGGDFTLSDNVGRNRIARLHVNGTLDTAFDPGLGFDVEVLALALDTTSGKLYVGGSFGSFNGTGRSRIARLNTDGTLDTAFDPGSGFNGVVNAIAFDAASGKLYVGGDFTSFNGTGRNRIARLNDTGSLDTGFNPGTGFDGAVNVIAVDASSKVYAGGYFSNFNGTGRTFIARVNANGTLDTGFDPGSGFNGSIFALAADTSSAKAYVGGTATGYGTSTIRYLARLTYSGALD